MDERSKPQNWWTTLPGLMTAFAGVITALSGLVAALNQAGVFQHSPLSDSRVASSIESPLEQAQPSRETADANRGLNYFFGAWENTDSSTRGLTRLNIRVSGTTVFVEAWGKCHPEDCAWGEVQAEAYSQGVDKSPAANTQTVGAVFKTNFKETTLTVRPEANNTLRVDTLDRFTDRSGRASYTASYLMRRAS